MSDVSGIMHRGVASRQAGLGVHESFGERVGNDVEGTGEGLFT